MANISNLRTLVQNGWTRNARRLFEQKLGKEQFNILKSASLEMLDAAPFLPKAATKGDDIYLSFTMVDTPFDFSDLPPSLRGKMKNGALKVLDSIFPTFKNEEINLKNIGDKFSKLDLDQIALEEEFYKELGFVHKKESYKISDLIKLKRVGDTATLQRDADFTSEVVRDRNEFLDTISNLFGKSKEEILDFAQIGNEASVNYAIKEKGNVIGYFSLNPIDDVLNVGNYVLYPQYRNSRSSMNAILTVRDRVFEFAKQRGINVIKADVDVNNPQLLGLYKRFGFQEDGREFYSFIDEFGKQQSCESYNLIGYLS